jgi:hypothetical protein
MINPAMGTPADPRDDTGAQVAEVGAPPAIHRPMSRRVVLGGAAALAATAGVNSLFGTAAAADLPAMPRWSQVHGAAPTANPVVVSGPMLLDIDTTVKALTIAAGGTLIFDPDRSATMQSRGNVVVDGVLRMRPSTAARTHTLRFIGINEAGFVGGPTHTPMASDPGLWMTGMDGPARLDLAGSPKRGWTRLFGPAAKGATTLTVLDATGWQAGDTVVVAPTEKPTTAANHYDRFDRLTVAAVAGNKVTLAAPLAWDHPTCTTPDGHLWTAEVVNLTRNVRIEGTSAGRAHVFIHGGKVDSFSHVELSHLGPRKRTGTNTWTDLVSGRYGLHFHHNGDTNRGLVVDGVVAHDLGNRGIVPHASHGITFTDSAVWDCFENGFWWDADADTDQSHDVLYDRCAVGRVRSDPKFRGYALAGFSLPAGRNATIRDCATFGILGNDRAAGYTWPATVNHLPDNMWTFDRNVAHNNKALGAFVWQNDANPHVTRDLTTYRCGEEGLLHGAYANGYRYVGYVSAEHGGGVDLSLHAAPRLLQGFTGGHIGHLLIDRHNLPSNTVGTFRDVRMGRITVQENVTENRGWWDFINCDLEPTDVTVNVMHAESVLRIQTGGKAWRITPAGVQSIPAFAS